MIKVKADPVSEANNILGDPGEQEFTFLLVSSDVYTKVLECARSRGCSVGEFLQNALLEYMENTGKRGLAREVDLHGSPDIVVRRR